MSHTIDATAKVNEAKDLTENLANLIYGKDTSVVMTSLSMLVGSIGAAFYDDDKDAFMDRLIRIVSESFDMCLENENG